MINGHWSRRTTEIIPSPTQPLLVTLQHLLIEKTLSPPTLNSKVTHVIYILTQVILHHQILYLQVFLFCTVLFLYKSQMPFFFFFFLLVMMDGMAH